MIRRRGPDRKPFRGDPRQEGFCSRCKIWWKSPFGVLPNHGPRENRCEGAFDPASELREAPV